MTTSGMEADYDAHSEYQRRVVEGGDKLIRSSSRRSTSLRPAPRWR